MAERKYYKAINFDLDTKILDEIHPSGSYNKAYYDLKRFFAKKNFEHRQGSGYVSSQKLTRVDIYRVIEDMSPSLPWMSDAVKKFDVTNIGTQYDLADDIRNTKKDSFSI